MAAPALRPGLPPVPSRMRALRLDERGYPVPWFVAWIDGKPDFRVSDARRVIEAVKFRRCWLCGDGLGRHLAFVIGPMCSVNRVSSEPPSHLDCALFAVQACPFLTRPRAHRRAAGLPEDAAPGAGLGIMRNPGVALVWITRSYRPFRAPAPDGRTGWLFEVGPPDEVRWFCEGRPATRAEIEASIESGLAFLEEEARAEGPRAVQALELPVARARLLLPAA